MSAPVTTELQGKCIGKGNMLQFKVFNVIWITYVVYIMVAMVFFDSGGKRHAP